METFLKKCLWIFYFCIALVAKSGYAQNSGLQEISIYNQFSLSKQNETLCLRVKPSAFEVERLFTHSVFLYGTRQFFADYRRPMRRTLHLPMQELYKVSVPSAYASVTQSHELFLPYKQDFTSNAFYSKPTVWVHDRVEIPRSQQVINILLNTAASFYVTWKQQTPRNYPQ